MFNLSFYCFLKIVVIVLLVTGCASNPQSDKIYDLVAAADKAYIEARWLEASQYYSQVIERVPQDHYAWFRLGNTQVRQGRIESAIYTYNEALKRDPAHAKTHYNLSITYMLIAMRSMQAANENIRSSDPGKRIAEQKLKALQKLVDQPAETRSQYSYLPRVGTSEGR